MSQTILGYFDGKVIIPEKPVRLPAGTRVRIQVELEQPQDTKKDGQARKIIGTGQFCSGIDDLGSNKKHLKGFGRS